jgi:hypothetical protein
VCHNSHYNRTELKRLRKPKGQSKMDNPEKLATKRTQEEEKQSKHATQYVLDTTIYPFKIWKLFEQLEL